MYIHFSAGLNLIEAEGVVMPNVFYKDLFFNPVSLLFFFLLTVSGNLEACINVCQTNTPCTRISELVFDTVKSGYPAWVITRV